MQVRGDRRRHPGVYGQHRKTENVPGHDAAVRFALGQALARRVHFGLEVGLAYGYACFVGTKVLGVYVAPDFEARRSRVKGHEAAEAKPHPFLRSGRL